MTVLFPCPDTGPTTDPCEGFSVGTLTITKTPGQTGVSNVLEPGQTFTYNDPCVGGDQTMFPQWAVSPLGPWMPLSGFIGQGTLTQEMCDELTQAGASRLYMRVVCFKTGCPNLTSAVATIGVNCSGVDCSELVAGPITITEGPVPVGWIEPNYVQGPNVWPPELIAKMDEAFALANCIFPTPHPGATVPYVIEVTEFPDPDLGGVLASAAPCFPLTTQNGNELPVCGNMNFDWPDAVDYCQNQPDVWVCVMLHEIMHAMGFISNVFAANGHIQITPNQNFFTGPQAVAEFTTMISSPIPENVPLEPFGGGSHLAEGFFDEEIMTPNIQPTPVGQEPCAISRVTVAMFEDLGYTVDYSKANYEFSNPFDPAVAAKAAALLKCTEIDGRCVINKTTEENA